MHRQNFPDLGGLTRRGTLLGLGAAATGARAEPVLLPTYAADRFVDSVGVCTHLESAPYSNNLDAVLRMGASLGVRHFRDEIRPTNNVANWRRVVADAQIRWHLLASPATNTIPEMLTFIRELGPRAVSAIEGQNEGDSPWFKAQPAARPGWAKVVVRYQQDLFRAVRAKAPAIPVVSPTVLDYQPDNMRLIRDASAFCDVVGIHAYVQGKQEPETDDPYAGVAWYLRNMRDNFKPAAPVMITETGYDTSAGGISPQAAGLYLPRLLLHLFDRGIERSFLYELMDEGHEAADPEQNFGLLTPEAAAKPSFHALRLLLGALSDPGPRFEPAPIALTVESGPADLRLVAFRKRGGSIVLAVWRALRAWDPKAARDVAGAAEPVRLTIGGGSTAEMLLLAEEQEWTATATRAERLDFEASATVRLIRLAP